MDAPERAAGVIGVVIDYDSEGLKVACIDEYDSIHNASIANLLFRNREEPLCTKVKLVDRLI
ncbi:hypothetical protein METUNv1_01251 [Methyloversatilis universalis FAM5]|uniref:Uncharacterized protein n=1 Tax=Methyloversatilis universalis (strain ATCC BAA-1314 / DSM 25237 / JCM 13912 / CCUG 52030 / FAM5) TaxID=1000565 RepID=F5RAN7_METUF|nr:hypothetical protein METUNv1_01251 [Methyloversatilis universalis FAM5]